jgi:hypothetical protein
MQLVGSNKDPNNQGLGLKLEQKILPPAKITPVKMTQKQLGNLQSDKRLLEESKLMEESKSPY